MKKRVANRVLYGFTGYPRWGTILKADRNRRATRYRCGGDCCVQRIAAELEGLRRRYPDARTVVSPRISALWGGRWLRIELGHRAASKG